MPLSQAAPRLSNTVDHALALHAGGRGRVSIARRQGGGSWHETSVPIADLGYVVRQLEGEPDIYLTQNRFFGRRRLVSQLAELDALFVDLDYYKTDHADAHPQHVLSLAMEALEVARIPPRASPSLQAGAWRWSGCTAPCRARPCPAGAPASTCSGRRCAISAPIGWQAMPPGSCVLSAPATAARGRWSKA